VFVGFAVFEAIRQMRKMTHELMDGALPEEELRKAKQVLDRTPELKGYHALRTRSVGARRFVELHAMFDDNISFVEAHRQAEQLEANLAAALEGAIVTVHYEPYEEEMQHQREHHAHE
jgi:ferrous-iron efflux pump FieF